MKTYKIIIATLFAITLTFVSGCDMLKSDSVNTNQNSENGNTTTVTTTTVNTTPIYEEMQFKSDELGNLKTTVSLDPNAKIKGKVAVVLKQNEDEYTRYEVAGFNPYFSDFGEADELSRLALSKERMAVKPEEIETLINVNCKKGKFIGSYKSTTDNQSVPAYTIKCNVSIIDYATKTVVAQKDFENDKPMEKTTISSTTIRRLNPIPWEDIEKYLKEFPVS